MTPFPPAPEPEALLQSVVDVARAIFGAAASSVFLLDAEAGELEFRAVSGSGSDTLIGTRMSAVRGIAGWVVSTGESLVVDDVTANPSFAQDVAESTGYVPRTIMAAPLRSREDVLGVLEVLDPARESRSDLRELDLLALFADQAALALRLADGARGRPAEGWADLGPRGTEIEARVHEAIRDLLSSR